MLVLLRSLSIAALLVLAGYRLGEVKGVVRAAGKPLSNVVVTFIPESAGDRPLPRSHAQTDAAGKYVLQTQAQEPGAVVGQHRVIIEDLAIYQAPRSPDGTVLKRPPARFAASYSDPIETPLIVEVTAAAQAIDLDLLPGP